MTRSDTNRAEAFSDAVIAIVITLLVLELTPPETEPGELLAGLLGQWPTYLAYAASYIYLAVIWLNHKSAFSVSGRWTSAYSGPIWESSPRSPFCPGPQP